MNFELYKDARGEYRWRLKAGNGRIVADSGEGYASSYGARVAIESFRLSVGSATITDLTAAYTR